MDKIKKVSQVILQHNDFYEGACVEVTLTLIKYMKYKYNIELTAHRGFLIDGTEKVPHLWASYHGKHIDLTSHKQEKINIKPIILKEAGSHRIESENTPSHFVIENDKQFEEWFFEYMDYALQEEIK